MIVFQYLLLLVPLALQLWLALALVAEKQHERFRLFFAYTNFSVVAGLLKLAVYSSYRAYFVAYWISEPVYVVLGTLALLETFPVVFKSFSWTRQFRLAIWVGLGVMILLSVLQAIFRPPIQATFAIATIYSVGIGGRYVQGGILVVFVFLALFYGIQPRRYASGIVLGFWVVSLGELIPAMLRSEFGTRFKFIFTYMPAVIYVIAVVIWLVTFSRPEPPDPFEQIKSPLSPEQVIERVRRLTKIIKGPE